MKAYTIKKIDGLSYILYNGSRLKTPKGFDVMFLENDAAKYFCRMKNKELNDEGITDIIFRKFKDGEIIALFPYIPEFRYTSCMSYMHVGQHVTAYLDIIRTTKLATETEYLDLYSELTNQIGYKLRIVKKVNWKKYSNEFHKTKAKK